MKTLAKMYRGFCKIEEGIVAAFVAVITFLVFISAIARGVNHPVNWAQDLALLLFAWVVFLGADCALRRADFVRVDMVIRYFPHRVQKFLYYLFYIVSIGFLGILVRFGIPLCFENAKRLFQTLGISYSWATVSAPAGAVLLMITIVLRLCKRWHETEIKVEGKEAI